MAAMADNLSFIKTGPEVASSIPTRSHTFVEIDRETIYTAILSPSTDSRKVAQVRGVIRNLTEKCY